MVYGFIIAVLVVIVLYLLYRLFCLKRSISGAETELREISQALDENRVVKLSVPDRELEKLLETVNQNLTDIRRQRRDYQQKEQKLKEQIENISHDLRTPLTAVLGYLKMIDREQLGPRDREYLEIAVRKSHTLQNLTAQFYELSRVTADDFSLKLELVDAFRILKESCLEHYALFEQEQLALHLPHMEGAATVYGNEEALRRVFSNLLQNSARYAKSELNIEAERNAEAGTVKIAFLNDIEPEQEISEAERLFERFYVQEQSRRKGGTGLGLTISKSLAEHMNGRLSAEYVGDENRRYLKIEVWLKGDVCKNG